MKKGFHLIILLFFSFSLFSQQEDSYLKNDFGLNINVILNKVFFKKINDEIENPFPSQLSILTYRHFVSPKLALRIGFGYDKFSRFDSTFSNFSGTLIEEDDFDFYAVHFGVQKNILDRKKVKLTLGWDWILRTELQRRTRNDFFFGGGIALEEIIYIDVYKETNFGIGIPMGIQYFLNDHIFISTELSLEAFHTFSKIKSEFHGNIGSGYRDKTGSINLKLRPPLGMFIHYQF